MRGTACPAKVPSLAEAGGRLQGRAGLAEPGPAARSARNQRPVRARMARGCLGGARDGRVDSCTAAPWAHEERHSLAPLWVLGSGFAFSAKTYRVESRLSSGQRVKAEPSPSTAMSQS